MAVSWIQIALDAENLPIAHKILISIIVCQVSVQSVILLTSNEVFRLNLSLLVCVARTFAYLGSVFAVTIFRVSRVYLRKIFGTNFW